MKYTPQKHEPLAKKLMINTFNIEAIEEQLAQLWEESALENAGDEAVLRARAANLLVVFDSESRLESVREVVNELSGAHPCRALLLLADAASSPYDIRMSLATLCRAETGRKQLSCEEILLSAAGEFIQELPSVALPLLVSDLPVFLWWHGLPQMSDQFFARLRESADRLIIDSLDFPEANRGIVTLAELCRPNDAGPMITDLNWTRLTSWRALLASFYDVAEYRPLLDQIESINIDYAPEGSQSWPAHQAFLLTGWLATRLGWEFRSAAFTAGHFHFKFAAPQGSVTVNIRKVADEQVKAGRLARLELATSLQSASFSVNRTSKHLETVARVGSRTEPGRILPVRNRSTATLLGRELEILVEDVIYEESVMAAAKMVRLLEQETREN